MKYSSSIQQLIEAFAKFPTVGPKTAARFVFYLLKSGKKEISQLITSLKGVMEKIIICGLCFKPFEPSSDEKICEVCSNKRRNASLLCVVEKETDLLAVENTGKYSGLYFILGGVVSTLKKEDFANIRNEELKKRLKGDKKIKEVIIATDATTEGNTTALYLRRMLAPFKVKITRLGQGLPVGGELEYADEETLSSALEGRK